MGKRGPQPKGRVKIKWSANFAYAIGLLVADGSLSKDGRHIDFTSKEIDQIKNFQRCLNLKDIKIGKKKNGIDSRQSYRIQFGDVLFYRWLVELGLMPNKSRKVGYLKGIPDNFFQDFLRGLFDGDGSSYSYWDPRWKSSFMFYIQFSSASVLFLRWLQTETIRVLGVGGKIQKGAKHTFQLRYAKNDSYIVLDEMYYKGAICLKRKFAKIHKTITIDQQQQKKYAQVAKLANALP